MKYYFFSDLHIQNSKDFIYPTLLKVLDSYPQKGDIVVFCGDIFDVYVGNKIYFKLEYAEFFNVLRGLSSKGILLYYIEGNHDFNFKKSFIDLNITIQYSEKEFSFLLPQGKKLYCAHGDLINKNDLGYLFLRFIYRSIPFKILLFLSSGKIIAQIGRFLSRYSRESKALLPSDLDEFSLKNMRKIYHDFNKELIKEGYSFSVLGHCHDLDENQFKENQFTLHYMNMGFPKIHGSYICLDTNEMILSRKKFDS